MKAGHQQELFDDERRSLGSWTIAAETLVAAVLLPVGPTEPLDYRVPDGCGLACAGGVPRDAYRSGTGDRTRVGYCVALATQETSRRLKELAAGRRRAMPAQPHDVPTEPVDRRPLSVYVDAGARHDAAGRRAPSGGHASGDDFIGRSRAVVARLEELNLPAKQAQVLRKLVAVGKPVLSAELMATVPCTAAPITALRRKGLIRSDVTRVRQDGYAKPVARARRESRR